ncbi:hypothetical protein [Paenibacillus sp. FSL H3-0469]|uniref:hypothetical protein n=1 Tax=Paenibacillus sp. FSL H3-0469 TaxID=2954506 RepID=UPI0031012CFE
MNKMKLYPKWAKPILVLAIGLIPAIVLSGCSAASQASPILADSPGMHSKGTTAYRLCS